MPYPSPAPLPRIAARQAASWAVGSVWQTIPTGGGAFRRLITARAAGALRVRGLSGGTCAGSHRLFVRKWRLLLKNAFHCNFLKPLSLSYFASHQSTLADALFSFPPREFPPRPSGHRCFPPRRSCQRCFPAPTLAALFSLLVLAAFTTATADCPILSSPPPLFTTFSCQPYGGVRYGTDVACLPRHGGTAAPS